MKIKMIGTLMAFLIIGGLGNLSWSRVFGQTGPAGGRCIAMGGVTSVSEEIWAAANNPALLAGDCLPAISICLENKYLTGQMQYNSVAGILPAGHGGLGFTGKLLLMSTYCDALMSLGYGRPFGEKVKIGINLVYHIQSAGEGFDPVHKVSYGLGTAVDLSAKVSLSFSTFNPFRLYYKSSGYATLPSVFNLGMVYRYAPAFLVAIELEKEMDFPLCVKTGMEYNFGETVFIRGGIRLLPFGYSFGTAWRKKRLLIEVSSSYHQYLGFSPVISFQYNLK
ncbi:MAG TPA: hypothetical protein PKM34_09775 [Bacteroidales bacterium]|nr:hypothetical protein [Bacteroidales bacterium]